MASESAAPPSLDSSTTHLTNTDPTSLESPHTFHYPRHYTFPPFFTLQPNQSTRSAQLASWSQLILSYFSFHRIFRISPSHPIFSNTKLNRTLAPPDARQVLQHMVERQRLEWADPAVWKREEREAAKVAPGGEGDEAWVWWRTAEEWAQEILAWVEDTGQRNRVLTLYELLEGEATVGKPFHGLPAEMAEKAIGVVLSRRGKATLMGDGGGIGAKFF